MTTTIQPGLLVALRTEVKGGVKYARVNLETDSDRVSKWETTKVVDDVAELASASKARSSAGNEIRKVCMQTSFGLLCPTRFEAELDAATVRAVDIAEAHNATAKSTRVRVWLLKGRIAETDEQAARAIASEVRALIEAMADGISDLDAEKVREAASRARVMSNVLGEAQQGQLKAAIEEARKAARAIVARVEKKGEEASVVLADLNTKAIETARMAFLDMQDGVREESEPQADPMPAVEVNRMAALADWDTAPEVV